jgi:FdrA protein
MLHTEVRPGAYYDSVLLMQLQRALAALPGVEQAGVVMGTPANKEVLAQSRLLTPEAERAAADDLIIVVQSEREEQGSAALAQIDALLAHRRSNDLTEEYRPKTLASAAQMLPEARWVVISVPGRFAAGLAHDALQLGKNVFLYSDNVSLEEEVALKQRADCW